MIERLPFEQPHSLPMRYAEGEHQRGPTGGMNPKGAKHFRLIRWVEVKEAVPCQDSVERFIEAQRPHVSH